MSRPSPIAPLLVPIVLAISVIAGGCGEDAEVLSATELVSRGDAICTEAQQRFTEIQGRSASNSVEVTEQTEELLDVATDEVNELRNLRPPEELREAYDSYLQAAAGVVDLLEDGRDAAEDRDGEAFLEAREQANAEQAERAKLARAVGFQVCAQSFSFTFTPTRPGALVPWTTGVRVDFAGDTLFGHALFADRRQSSASCSFTSTP